VIGYLLNDDDDSALESTVEDLFTPLGRVIKVTDEDQFEALMVSCSSGTGFVFEMMMYWQD
jgi:pyrroline-5-carboxylate reductase